MKKKLIALLLVAVLALGVAACGGKTDTPASGSDVKPSAAPATETPADTGTDTKTYTVGVCQLVQHAALDAATQGFVDALTAALGDAVTIKVQNASGDSVNCGTIVNGFLSENVDLIMANATPALTAAVSATDSIPILGTSVTAYSVALDLDDFNGTVGGNVSGTSDLADLSKQAQMILDTRELAAVMGDPARIRDLVETRLIGGQPCLVIRTEGGVEVNGVSIHLDEPESKS